MNETGLSKGDDEDDSVNLLHSFSNGAWLGVKVAGLIFANVLCIVSALYTINGLLAWIGESSSVRQQGTKLMEKGQFWGIARSGNDSLSIELIGGYLLYPFTFMLGVPPADILPVARLISTKIVANEFVAFDSLSKQAAANPEFISARAQLIAR
jgi:CNT family concentrative nucleoside transporter